jgi:hypothetical protein
MTSYLLGNEVVDYKQARNKKRGTASFRGWFFHQRFRPREIVAMFRAIR